MWKEDQNSEKFITEQMKEAQMQKGSLITKDDIIALRSGRISGDMLVNKWRADGKLPPAVKPPPVEAESIPAEGEA